jgi:serine/threonine-protein kinase ATR
METLLARSIVETDHDARIRLAECLGEVGAIDINLLHDDMTVDPMRSESVDNSDLWRRVNPPWRSIRARYELQLVTNHLVQGLKAAPSSGDQHKIGFCIQQLLVHLDKSIREPQSNERPVLSNGDRDTMSDWLKSQLTEAGVMDIVEPFWHTEFHEAEGVNFSKQPPFFQKSSTYFSWISSWCRHMIYRSNESKSPWGQLFFACRTAVRTTAGLSTSEFLLPVLVLDRLCFGNSQDEHIVISEIRDALTTTQSDIYSMDLSELQKAVNVVFTVIDTLQRWAEEETEKRHHISRKGASSSHSVSALNAQPAGNLWPLDDSIMRIEDMLLALPLSLRAQAAAKIGMNARALRLLEMAARESIVDVVFNGACRSSNELEGKWHKSCAAGNFSPVETDRVNNVLAELQDYETMGALESNTSDPLSSAKDCIRLKEAGGDWAGALPDYERALQLNSTCPLDMVLQRGSLRCLLELGHYESVLNQVHGIVNQNQNQRLSSSANGPNESAVNLVVPLGIEAAWRLGRWDTLSELAAMGNGTRAEPEARFQQSVGKVMLGIHRREQHMVEVELKKARDALMVLLSSSARESYSRAYEHVVKLQSLREIEDVSVAFCKESKADLRDLTSGLCWKSRLDFVSESGMKDVVKSRLALSRLADDRVMEGSLFLHLGQRARKSRSYNIAATCFAQAEAVFISPHSDRLACSDMMKALQLQVAKLKHACGESSAALKILSAYDDLESAAEFDNERLIAEVSRRTSLIGHDSVTRTVDDKTISIFVRSALQATLWMIEGGLRSSTQIENRFRAIHKIAPGWERGKCVVLTSTLPSLRSNQNCIFPAGHFQYAKYIDGLSESRMKALVRRLPQSSIQVGLSDRALRGRVIDKTCQKYILLAMKHYGEALKLGMKHVYQSLPRLLSLWFDSTSIRGPENPPDLVSISESRRSSTGKSFAVAPTSNLIFLLTCFRRCIRRNGSLPCGSQHVHGAELQADTSDCILYCNSSTHISSNS